MAVLEGCVGFRSVGEKNQIKGFTIWGTAISHNCDTALFAIEVGKHCLWGQVASRKIPDIHPAD